jgi:hypothetical protein
VNRKAVSLRRGNPILTLGPRGDRRGAAVIEPEHIELDLPRLDRKDDPRGGAVAWALLAVGMALVAGILLTVIWAVKLL